LPNPSLHLTANSVVVFQSSVPYQSLVVIQRFVPTLLAAGVGELWGQTSKAELTN
jgi:hypothetical protein